MHKNVHTHKHIYIKIYTYTCSKSNVFLCQSLCGLFLPMPTAGPSCSHSGQSQRSAASSGFASGSFGSFFSAFAFLEPKANHQRKTGTAFHQKCIPGKPSWRLSVRENCNIQGANPPPNTTDVCTANASVRVFVKS